ncbi:sulfurtransferase complex subunit TusB [Methylomicrobium sp. Wu6]|uniref:sulfurtransferase complex subunit TusB n=1 Tax=Methylomicrobium sp. Wu6 TaxID=3107928 RepID=UPI002DD639D3|nr:sulfurtransferase complex subunit TusB [Methylomicrobium sp. Wu6]MEC4749936.1 sulfurtransferase complex subunit TusB [Methylomicrobium sp. Wu6]
MLHLISASPIPTAVLERIDAGSSAVFMENAVLWILRNSQFNGRLTGMLADHHLYALSADLIMRGIDADQIVPGIDVIDYAGLVELTVAHPLIQSWS